MTQTCFSKPIGQGLLILFILFLPSLSARAQSLDSLAGELKTPESLADFMQRNFSFVEDEKLFDRADYWQAPEEMLLTEKGDCEDYALFSEAILNRSRYEAFLFSVFGEEEAHTVAVFGKAGEWRFFDAGELRFSNASSLSALAAAINPNWSYSGIMRREGNSGIILQKFKREPDPAKLGMIFLPIQPVIVAAGTSEHLLTRRLFRLLKEPWLRLVK